MDEVDIDNVEDINELEARLYAQIHHDTADEPKTNSGLQQLEKRGKNNDGINNENDADFRRSFQEPSKRYWSSGERTAKHLQKDQSQHFKHRFIRNPFKTPSNSYEQRLNILSCPNSSRNQLQHGKQQGSASNLSQSLKLNEDDKIAQNYKSPTENITSVTLTSETDSPEVATASPFNENKKNKTTKADQNTTKQKLPANKSNLKLNPVADWIKRKKNQINKKADNKSNNNINAKNAKNSSINVKQGLFARQQQKLLKAKRFEEKKQKSKKARNTAAGIAVIANNLTPTEIIDLNSDNESDSSDVVMIPAGPLPTYIVDDSGDEDDKDEMKLIVEHEENALDSADVQMSSKTACFIKPQEISTQSLAAVDGIGIEKRLENSSRCTSPCSLQSSDDFIGQTDRSRLLAGASGMADDEDLLVLTSDINSLLEVSNISKQANNQVILEKETNPIDSSIKQVREENIEETNDSLEFAAPKSTNQQSRPNNYRVDQGQFRALDVYESESDITDTVYSKGAHKQKQTVIRQIDTSSDEGEDISICSQRTKRLRKRRASSSNKESDPNNTNFATSSDNEEVDEDGEDDNEVLRTSIPFIAKGPAVERYKPQKRSRTLYSCSPIIRKRKSADKRTATGHMSDTEFIATLNNLAQGQEGEQKNQDLEEAEESETENTPTAREIAEKILAQHKGEEKNDQPAADDVALPQDILNELDKVFESIDQLDRQQFNQLPMDDDTVRVSDSSDSDREKHLVYKSVPNEDAQIIKYSPDKSETQKSPTNTRAKNGAPIYNVIYSRGQRKPGGIGWNDEMRKFYNESWNGEHFILSKILQKMNPDRRLWKIYTEDRFNIKSNKRSNLKCTNCCEYGHMRSKCRRPRKPMICYMCGDSGHHEPRCPNTICLRCGNKTQVFTKMCNACSYLNRLTCPICKIRGHSLDYCPDKWRRYHSTTEANSQPNNSIRYNPRKYCCICGARGHISDNCRSAVRFSEYPAIASTIKSHQKSYNDVVIKAPYNGIALNLMYEPCQEYKFDLAALTSSEKYYGRFLKSVGMDHLFKRKRQMNTVSLEMSDTNAKKAKRLSKKYEPSPYSKAGTAIQKNIETIENAPNQVPEITESGNSDQQDNEKRQEEEDVINIEENSDNEVELIDCTVEADDLENIELNATSERPSETAEHHHVENFKSPKNVTSTSLAAVSISTTSQRESALTLDSDSNYSFSEHFDTTENSENATTLANTAAETFNEQNKDSSATASSRPKAREMETLPDYIPLIDSTANQNEQHDDNDNPTAGISRRFVAADSGDDEMEENRRNLNPLPELPCEAKIYLTHFHSKYLLSPAGNAFLVKASRAHNLKARLDFTSVGHVLVIFGMPTNQDKLQRELLMKYRELEDERNQKQIQSNLNVPKRTYVLIRFLRDNITQLMTNLGNVNYLLKRLQFLERQQTKSGYKLAEKVRRSLNMILVGQAGLQDGTMHLDKLLLSLKTLLNDVRSEIAPPELRSEITDHWKFIFSAYRHENYQKLVDTYNKLISKNRIPQLNIDPVLLGQKVLDTHFSEEQIQKLEQAKTPTLTNAITNTNTAIVDKQIVPNPMNQKNTKPLKRKQNADINTAALNTNTKPKPTNTSRSVTAQSETSTARSNNNFSKIKTNSSKVTSETANKAKQSTNTTNPTATTTTVSANETSKKQPQKVSHPPPFENPEQRSTVSTTIQQVTDKWKSTCDTLLTEISSEKAIINKNSNGDKVLDSKLPSVFWSRESMRYLDICIHLASARPEVKEKLQRIQQKSKNGQLSYNDYLAVIKLHTALNGK